MPSTAASSTSPTPATSSVSSSVLLSSVWQLLLHVFIPASLANEAARQQPLQPTVAAAHSAPPPLPSAVLPSAAAAAPSSSSSSADSDSELQCCDLVLVRTPGVVYRQFRRLASHSFDHLAIAVSAHSVLHVGPPTVRLLPAALLLQPRRRPLILRPALSDEQRTALIQSLTPLIGRPYDTVRVLALIATLATAQTADKRRQRRQRLWTGQQRQLLLTRDSSNDSRDEHSASLTPLPSSLAGSSQSSLICTDAILDRLWAVSARFRHIVQHWRRLSESSALLPLDLHTMHSWSINDLHRIAHASQQLRTELGDVPAPFFTIVQSSVSATASQRDSYGPRRTTNASSQVPSLSASPLASVSSSMMLIVCVRLLRRGLGGMCNHSLRSVSLLSFALFFSTFLPIAFRVMVVLLAILLSLQHSTVASSRRLRAVRAQLPMLRLLAQPVLWARRSRL